MKNIIYIAFIILLASLQTTVFSDMNIMGGCANLLLALTVIIALSDGPVLGGIYGMICGVVTDTLSFGRFGYSSLMFMYFGVGCGIFKEQFFRNNGVVVFIFSFACSFIHQFLYFIFAHYIWKHTHFFSMVLTRVVVSALLTSLVTLLFYFIKVTFEKRKVMKGNRRRYGF